MKRYEIGSLTQMMAMTNYYSTTSEDKAMMNLPFAIHLKGELDIARLERAIGKVTAQKIMNTYLCAEGDKFYANEKEPEAFHLDIEKIEGGSEEEKVKKAMELAAARAIVPLPIFGESEKQYYFRLLEITESYHILLMTVHHTFLDFGAVMIVINYIFRSYNDENYEHMKSAEFSAFMTKELEFWGTDEAEKEDMFWSKELDGAEKIDLSEKLSDPDGPKFEEKDLMTLFERKELEEMAVKYRTSVFNIMMLIIHMALAKVNDSEDTLTQYAVSNRSDMDSRYTLGCLTRILSNRVKFDDDMDVMTLNKLMRKKMGDGYQNRHVAGKTPLGSIPYVIANEDMGDLDVAPMFNGAPVQFDFVDLPRKLDFVALLILPFGADKLALGILTDVAAYGQHAREIVEAAGLSGRFIAKYPERTFGDFMRNDITADTLDILDAEDDVEIIEI